MQNVDNAIGDIPSVKLHAPPGGVTSVSIGGPIDVSSAPVVDRSDDGAMTLLAELNHKMATEGKLGVRDFNRIASFPLFEHMYSQHQISQLRYADKVNATPSFLKVLNTQFGGAVAPAPVQQMAMPAMPDAPVMDNGMFEAPVGGSRTANRGGGAGGMQNVGNTIGEVPSVKLHAPPGGASAFGSTGATMAMLGGGPDPTPVNHSAAMQQPGVGGEGPIRTANRSSAGGTHGAQNVGNSIGDIPSVKLHAPPGGATSVSFGAEIDTNAAPQLDRSDASALQFLMEANAKYQASGKLGVRDFLLVGSFPLFEHVYNQYRISSLSYAEKVNISGSMLKALNAQCGTMPAPVQCAAVAPTAPMPSMDYQQPVSMSIPSEQTNVNAKRTANRSSAGGTGGMQNVNNFIGDIPSVKLHAPPGGASQIAFG